uniref:Uncharacterized protein n=1 Tax=viral metagenome TaxID=1070528 RepID=A0A6C0DIZ4_9ZZZZ
MNKNVNYGGKQSNYTGIVKKFKNDLNYPLKQPYMFTFVKAFPPYTPIGDYIKNLNNYTPPK